jgi:hypothetical protein
MAKLIVRVRASEEGQGPEQDYSRDIDAAGVPGVGEILRIEVDGSPHELKVMSRRFDFSDPGTTVIVEAVDQGDLATPMIE